MDDTPTREALARAIDRDLVFAKRSGLRKQLRDIVDEIRHALLAGETIDLRSQIAIEVNASKFWNQRGALLESGGIASDNRLAALPDVPTAAEAGLNGYVTGAWFAFLAPRGTPRPIVARINREIVTAMADPAVRSRFAELGAEPLATTPEELTRHISVESAKWREIITKGGIPMIQ